MSTVFELAGWALVFVTAGVLVWGFARSRNPGYLVLIVALPAWTLLRGLLAPIVDNQVDRAINGEALSFPFSLIGGATAGQFIANLHWALEVSQTVLLLLGLLLLIRLPHHLSRKPGPVAPKSEPDVRSPV